MGNGRFSSADWSSYTASAYSGKTTDQIFSSKTLSAVLNPHGVKMRESRDSELNPESSAIIVAIDVTGSMGILADNIVREGLGVLFQEIYDKKPVLDPQIMFMAVGDAYWDKAPLQVSQFEADMRIVDQLESIYVEKGGGGNDSESYSFPWYFAARHTSIDCYEKRGKKGFLFTVGDEQCPPLLPKDGILRTTGDNVQADISSKDLLAEVQKMYHVFHIVITQGSYASSYPDAVRESWNHALPQRTIFLDDYRKLAETVVSTIRLVAGEDRAVIAGSYADRETVKIISTALSTVVVGKDIAAAGGKGSTGLTKL